MKFVHSNHPRALARSLALTLGVVLLVGSGSFQARAQGTDTTDKTTKAVGTSPDTITPRSAPMPLGDDTISQTQSIKASFVISVTVVGEPDPSGQYAVDQAGNINMKYAGIMTPVKVVGKTPDQAAAAIVDFLKTYVKNPQVSVVIVAVPRPVIFIGGAVRISGPLVIGSEVTLIDALSRAELTENADLTRVLIYRKQKVGSDEKSVPITVDFEKFFRPAPGETPDDSQNPLLKDKDRIVVPSKTRPGQGMISVFGEVEKTQRDIPLPSTQTLTVREAINLVGGTRQAANRKAVIIRRVGEDRPLVIDLDKAEQGDLVNNITLRPDDTVYVEKLENNAYININGGLVKPGKLVYDKRTTLTQAVEEAGGVAPFAHQKYGVIYRHPDNDAKRTQVIQFNFKDISKGKAQDIELLPGDSVFIETGQAPRQRDLFDYFGLLGSVGYLSYLFR
jgi:protein involved in polysaccharide export with SLBB domain